MSRKRCDVVCAVIKSADVINKGGNDLFLIAKRAKNKIHSGKWEFPGGKVEHEETHSDAVKREEMEELGVEIEITKIRSNIPTIMPLSSSCLMSVSSPTTARSHKQRKWSIRSWLGLNVGTCGRLIVALSICFTVNIPQLIYYPLFCHRKYEFVPTDVPIIERLKSMRG